MPTSGPPPGGPPPRRPAGGAGVWPAGAGAVAGAGVAGGVAGGAGCCANAYVADSAATDRPNVKVFVFMIYLREVPGELVASTRGRRSGSRCVAPAEPPHVTGLR